jgi:hypothetical protein
MMFEVGKIVFSKTFGWMKVIEAYTNIFWAESVGDTNLYCFYNDKRYEKNELFLDVFESPDAMIEYFQQNIPPKPKKLVTKTVEGWIGVTEANEFNYIPLFVKEPYEPKFIKATLTFEIEE